mmetsp:Transcript_20379/g.46237  ORF Transcript_20379/g.46237 Transcript_20379/m.46237 type:complete len:203 (-) Transcript_20379:397-1005(-)
MFFQSERAVFSYVPLKRTVRERSVGFSSRRLFFDITILERVFPISSIKITDLHAINFPDLDGRIARLQAMERNGKSVGIRSGYIKRTDSTNVAKHMSGRTGPVPVSRHIVVDDPIFRSARGFPRKPQTPFGNDQVCVPSHGADGAVAVPDDQFGSVFRNGRRRNVDLEPDFPAVTSPSKAQAMGTRRTVGVWRISRRTPPVA